MFALSSILLATYSASAYGACDAPFEEHVGAAAKPVCSQVIEFSSCLLSHDGAYADGPCDGDVSLFQVADSRVSVRANLIPAYSELTCAASVPAYAENAVWTGSAWAHVVPTTEDSVVCSYSPLNEVSTSCADVAQTPIQGRVQWCPNTAGDSVIVNTLFDYHYQFTSVYGRMVVQHYWIHDGYSDLIRTTDLDSSNGHSQTITFPHTELTTMGSPSMNMRIFIECETVGHGQCSADVNTLSFSEAPSGQPTGEPTTVPTSEPSSKPSSHPTANPTAIPTASPTFAPTTPAQRLATTLDELAVCGDDKAALRADLCQVQGIAGSHANDLTTFINSLSELRTALAKVVAENITCVA